MGGRRDRPLAGYLARMHPGLRGFKRANLFRMRQFYETYAQDEKVAPLVRQLPWTHNLLNHWARVRAGRTQIALRLAAKESWSKRRTRMADERGSLRENGSGASKRSQHRCDKEERRHSAPSKTAMSWCSLICSRRKWTGICKRFSWNGIVGPCLPTPPGRVLPRIEAYRRLPSCSGHD